MRKYPSDNYFDFALLGNNIYDMNFMFYLFQSQNVNSYYYDKYKIKDSKIDNSLKNIAYYLGTREPILIDDETLRQIFHKNNLANTSSLPNLSSQDMIEQINNCIKSDAIYVCNADNNLDKYTMFILGYLMALEQEIFFWNDIDKSEWLMASILKKNNGCNEIVQFPLDFIRTMAYPYLLKKVDSKGNFGVARNIEFNLNAQTQDVEDKTISLLGSLRKQLQAIQEVAKQKEAYGYKILGPLLSNVKTDENGFVIFEDDISNSPIIIERDFIEKCLKSEEIIVCDESGYIGNTVAFEIGYLLAKQKKIKFIEQPSDQWISEVVEYFSLPDKKTFQKTFQSIQGPHQ